MDEISDRALVPRLLAGDDRAFEILFERAFPMLSRFALLRVGGDRQLAEDLAQATLCRAIDKLATYNGKATLMTWLHTICRHQIDDHFARLARRPRQLHLAEESAPLRAALGVLAQEMRGPDEELQRREVTRCVHAVLQEVPAHYARILTWKYLEDLPVQEIASRLELSSKAAESLLTRARRAFREAFVRAAAALAPAADQGDPT